MEEEKKFDERTLPIGYDSKKDKFLRCSDLSLDVDINLILKYFNDCDILKKVVLKRIEEAPFMKLLSPKISTREEAINNITDDTEIGRVLIEIEKIAIKMTIEDYCEGN